MNKSLLFFMLALIAMMYQPLRTNAQADFAPVGAKWYYSYSSYDPSVPGNGSGAAYVLQESVGDTVIQGITARKLKRTSFSRNPQDNSILSSSMNSVYVYGTEDTVFHFDEPLGRFLPLYLFNVQAGDTIVHRIPSAYTVNPNDTIWKSRVDSVVTASYNNQPLKVVYSGFFPITVQERSMPLRGPYYQYIGLVEGHLSEYAMEYPVGAAHERYQLRCYQDANFDIHFSDPAVACDSLAMRPVSVADVDFLSRKLSVYPNPVSDEVHIALDGLNMQSLEVMDLLGRSVLKLDYSSGTTYAKLSLSGMNKGTYILRVTNKEQGAVYRKILLQ